MRTRRHHNNYGKRQLKTGSYLRVIERLQRLVGVKRKKASRVSSEVEGD